MYLINTILYNLLLSIIITLIIIIIRNILYQNHFNKLLNNLKNVNVKRVKSIYLFK